MKLNHYICSMAAAGAVFLPVVSDALNTSWLVYNSPAGLVYTGYANEGQANTVNTIPDFSKAGYQGGGVPIPFVPAAVTLSDDGPADDTARIQNAINSVSALPVGPDGFRGAVLLEAGEYTVSSTLTISKSGVVIRGAGSQENGGTRITYTATTQSDVFAVSGGSGPSELGGTRVGITDSFVPVGARTFTVSSASGYAPGDQIIVQNTVNQQWLDDMSNMSQWGWTVSSYQLIHRYVITAVNGNQITIDAPIVQTIEDQYGGGDVYKYNANLLENVGIEALRLESTYFHIADEDHGRYGVRIDRLQNGWVRQVTTRYFVQGTVSIDSSSQYITVEDCAALDHKSMISGGRRYSFSIDDSQYLLVQRCLTREGRHDYVSGSRTPGPNAFVDCRADSTHADIGPHHRYATGQIYDNIMGGAMGVKNARSGGSGHGWTGAQILFWNCDAESIRCDAPNGAMNWCVGSIGEKLADGGGEPFGTWDSHNIPVTPRSLYYTQLAERLGTNALNSIILSKQRTGTIWTELHEWDGGGLFLDELLVLADEETIPAVGESLAIRGIVRNLAMLDRGATSSWRKVYGPGSATFADALALETTVSFTQNGAYLLELSVNDGVSVVRSAVTVQVGAGSSDTTPPAAPANLVATDSETSISLEWTDNSETDLAGYDVFRSTVPGDDGIALVYGLTSSEYTDLSAEKGVFYYYTVRAVDTNSNISALSAEALAIVNALPTIEFVQPLDGQNFNENDSLHVIVDAADKGGTIANVQLFLDDQSVGQDTASPYEWGAEGQNDPLLQNMAVGTYVLKAIATDDQGTSATNSIIVTVTVDVTAPAAPTGLFATADYGWVSLNWDDNSEHDLAEYNVYRSTTPGSYGAALTNVADSSYYDLGLAGGITYYYRVTASDTNGFVSTASSEVWAIPKQVPPGMILFGYINEGLGGFTQSTPAATEFWSTDIGSVQYKNTDTGTQNASLLKSYTLDRSDGSSYTIEGVITLTDGYAEDNNRVGLYLFGGGPDVTAEGGGSEEDELGALCVLINFEGGNFKVMQGIDRSLIADAFHGRAKDYTWFGEDINISVDITFNGSDIDLVATLTDAQDNVTTVNTSVAAASYTGDYFGFATRSRTRDFGVPGAIKSAPFTMDYRSFWVTAPDDTAPATPTGLAATAGNSLVSLDWNDNAEDELDTYTVYRSTTSGSYEEPLITGLSSSEYIDYLADNNTTYFYVVTASDYHANESSQSAEVSATPVTGPDPIPPAAPAHLVAVAGDGSVSLNWDDNGEGDLDSYSVYRSTTSGGYSTALVNGLSLSDYTDDSAVNGTTYYYVVTAIDTSSNESAQSDEVSTTPEGGTGYSDVVIFGSNNDGLGGFMQTAGFSNVIWSTATDSVRYRNQDGGAQNSSLLKEFVFDRSNGKSYTTEGVVHLTDGYADDNNRVGIYLFGDSATVPNEDEAGAIGLIYNSDDSVTGGAPGNNNPDALAIRVGIDNTNLSGDILRNQTVPFAQDLFGTEITFTVDITFTNIGGTDSIVIEGRMEDVGATSPTVSTTVDAAAYTGNWFGFVTRARARNYPTDPTPTAEERSLPWVMDYRSFSVVENSVPVLEGYALWAAGWGTYIGDSNHDWEPDGLANWVEYALGGNPISNDASDILPEWSMGTDGGTNWFYYTYHRRDDAAARGLTYTVWSGTNLVDGLSNALPAWDVSPATNGFESATHRISTDDESNAFMQLEIELSE